MGVTRTDNTYTGDIAVIGMSCRFPGAGEDVDKFWHSIASGECMSTSPEALKSHLL
jgi:zearalenone synthase (highly reducing iterative type I polyketide synthase)